MTARKRKSKTKKQKKAVIVEKQVPDFDDIYGAVLDSYALIFAAYKILEESNADDDDGYAAVVLRHGVTSLKQASERLEDATNRLDRFCRQNKLPQDDTAP